MCGLYMKIGSLDDADDDADIIIIVLNVVNSIQANINVYAIVYMNDDCVYASI